MEVTLNPGDLLTVAGASAAAFIIAQFAKMLFTLGPALTRSVALLTGLAVVVVATVQSGEASTVIGIILAVVVGAQAGLAAVALFDTARSGLDYVATRVDADTPPTD